MGLVRWRRDRGEKENAGEIRGPVTAVNPNGLKSRWQNAIGANR